MGMGAWLTNCMGLLLRMSLRVLMSASNCMYIGIDVGQVEF